MKLLKSYVSPSTGEALPFCIDTNTQSNENKPSEEDDMYSGACFDLVAAALAYISGSASTIESERTEYVYSPTAMRHDAISALFATNESQLAESPEALDVLSEDFGAAILEAKNNSIEKVVTAEYLNDSDIPEVNIVKFNCTNEENEDE
jgi:hypothetical protein